MTDGDASRKLVDSMDLPGLATRLVKAEESLIAAREHRQALSRQETDASNAERAAQRQRDIVADAVSIKIGRLPK